MAKKKSAGAKYFGKPLSDDPDDAPELLNDFFRHGELRQGGRLIRRGRPPLSGKPKTAITLRLDEECREAYRETGEGWQTRINADLAARAQAQRQDYASTAERKARVCSQLEAGPPDESVGPRSRLQAKMRKMPA